MKKFTCIMASIMLFCSVTQALAGGGWGRSSSYSSCRGGGGHGSYTSINIGAIIPVVASFFATAPVMVAPAPSGVVYYQYAQPYYPYPTAPPVQYYYPSAYYSPTYGAGSINFSYGKVKHGH